MRIGYILLPNYSSMTYVSSVEPLIYCNELLGESTFQTFTVALANHKTISSLGNPVETHYSLYDAPDADVWVIAGASPSHHPKTEGLNEFLSQINPSKTLCGLASASYTLAQVGLLDGYRAAIHWPNLDAVIAEHKTVRMVSEPYCIDGNRLTCRGGISSLGLMLSWLAQNQEHDIAEAVMTHFEQERLGIPSSQLQRELSNRTRSEQPKLAEALELMENNIEEPLSTDDIAFHINLSRRQLERLFKQHLNTVPSRYYLKIRLEEARKQLLNSFASVAEIAFNCGFSSGAHFSTAYRNQYRLTPSEERNLNRKIQASL